jgi:hypothetical protein
LSTKPVSIFSKKSILLTRKEIERFPSLPIFYRGKPQ